MSSAIRHSEERSGGGRKTPEALARLHSARLLNRSHCYAAEGGGSFAAPTGRRSFNGLLMRHIIPISGKDSLATALLQTARHPELPYEYVFCDTGAELPETYDWLKRVQEVTGFQIQRVGRNLEALIQHYDILPSHGRRFCTKEAKIQPLEKFYGKTDCAVYYGLRADENRVGVRPSDLWTPVYPLVDMGIDLRGVWVILNRKDLLPPSYFWPSLYYRVLELMGSRAHLIEELEPWEQRMLFAGRTRSNCYFCFYQRVYEFAWLAETHPDLFAKICWFERFGTRRRRPDSQIFTWNARFFADDKIGNERHRIVDTRARQVIQTINNRFNRGLFDDPCDTEIALTSCGLLCGK